MKKVAWAALITLAAGGAQAQVYVGASLGASRFSTDCSGTSTCDLSDTAYKVYGGYQFRPAWSAEVSYIHFGSFNATGSYGSYQVDGNVKSNALALALAGRAEVSSVLSGVMRVGLANVNTRLYGVVRNVGSGSDSQSDIKPYLGLGIDIAFTKQWHGTVNADFTQAQINELSATNQAYTVGVQYGF